MAGKARRKAGKHKSRALPGWIYMLAGLAIGLAVAAAIYVSDRQEQSGTSVQQPTLPATVEPAATESPAAEEPTPPEVTFDFYDMLPNLDVEVYEDERAPAQKPVPTQPVPARPVQAPGIYILQAGSFSRLADANRRKAQIALLGIRTEIKQGTANGRTVYRVYTDPMANPADVNRVSELLTRSGIEILSKRVSD